MASTNKSWKLESFLDSLIVELDKARETLAVKAINKPLTYAVKDVNLEMQLFPSFDGNHVEFITARPGQQGASKIGIQLGSITDQQIRKTTKEPVTSDDVSIDLVDEIDEDTKQSLRKIGVTSVEDLNEVKKKNVDIEKASNRKVNYAKLAKLLSKARRGNSPPNVKNVHFNISKSGSTLQVEGNNLVLDNNYTPVVVFNGKLADLRGYGKENLEIGIDERDMNKDENELVVVSDPYTIYKMNLNHRKQ
ncbi:hypothetical protein [Sinomicrobium weinanense]|uniref:Uncharacterized protein n=1 Tax=Sinomicrobium weinanense TaxID=2842200 RepID=A0A926JNZ0_9FLAO|nr:hypothetical protein [Sinomicrobium weinanense]MBC9794795.1 hypothetical protein [Sinomicrobium weinanense]MBU3125054.1 hypothetical protein [Sinomicrobium weinanense]